MNIAVDRTFSDYRFTPRVTSPEATAMGRLGSVVERVAAGARSWCRASMDQRIDLVASMQRGYLGVAGDSVRAACLAKGLDFDRPEAGEEWLTGPWCVVRQLRLVRESLQSIAREGTTPIGPVGETADGHRTVQVFPGHPIDGILFKDCRVDVHMAAGVSEADIEGRRAAFYRQHPHDGRVVLVLGAGNIASIPAMDVITKLFNEGKACILKMSPVNAWLGPFLERAFHRAIEEGWLSVTYGGPEVGAYLARHPDVDEIHITGSRETYEQIVWGLPGPEREARQRRNERLTDKPVSAELGNISPVILVPGPYSEQELRYQARDVAGYLAMNASFLCNSAKMVVIPAGWEGGERFLRYLEEVMASVPPRRPWYPGAAERWNAVVGSHAQARRIGDASAGTLPWALICDLDADDPEEPMFRQEPFCAVLGQTAVGSDDAVEFLDAAVDFCNRRLWGTLSATLIAHPRTQRDAVTGVALEQTIRRLRYGTVAVNCFPGLGFAFAAPPWGGFPGADPQDIQSGTGFVHNVLMLEGIEKAVIRSPLTMFPKAAYQPGHRTAHRLGRRLVGLEQGMQWRRLPGVVFNAMRG